MAVGEKRAATASRPPIGERVTGVEVELKNLKDTVEVKFEEVKAMILAQSLNGRTERAKALVDAIGSEEDRDTLRSMIRAHDRREWLGRPLWRAAGVVASLVAAAVLGHFWPS